MASSDKLYHNQVSPIDSLFHGARAYKFNHIWYKRSLQSSIPFPVALKPLI